ncbi:MAG: DegT/DnrJ/EryC1/StrS family aminotransferase [Planctomycetota bacterium]
MDRIPNAGPWVTEREVEYVADAARHAWYGNANVYNLRFEHAFAKYIGVPHAVSVPHCTSAIHLPALVALGIGPGDEVIVPDITWIATSAPWISCCRRWHAGLRGCRSRDLQVSRAAGFLGGMYLAANEGGDPRGFVWRKAGLDSILAAQARRRHCGHRRRRSRGHGVRNIGGRKAGSFGDAGVFSFHGSANAHHR